LGVWWAHADSGDGPDIYEHSFTGQYLGLCHLDGATATDWEDMGVGPGPVAGVSYIYLGDIGDNGANRNLGVQIYRFPEPVVYTRQADAPVARTIPGSVWEVMTVTYPGIIFFREEDAETMMIDPRTGDLIIAQKLADHIPVFRAEAASLFQGSAVGLTKIADISTPGWRATGGDIQAQGKELIIRGYGEYRLLWQISAGQTIGQALAGPSYVIPYRSEGQGEAIGYERSGSGYMTVSEGGTVDLWHFARTSNDGPTPIFTVIPPESQWRYLDNGTDQGDAWRNPGFNDSGWKSDHAHMGYGEGDEQTVVSYGGNPSSKYVTTYFRKTFWVDAGVDFESLLLRVVYEGGVAVYLNGTEVLRKSLAAGASYTTLATGTRGATKYSWLTTALDEALLLDGENVIAVEVHLASTSQADLSFDFQIEGTLPSYALTLRENEANRGVVSVIPAPNSPEAWRYLSGTILTLNASALENYSLKHWLVFDAMHPGDLEFASVFEENPLVLPMTGNREVEVVWQFEVAEGEGVTEGTTEGVTEGEGAAEGTVEGGTEGEGQPEGIAEGMVEGVVEGVVEGEGDGAMEGEGVMEGEGFPEGQTEGTADGEGLPEGLVEGEGGEEGQPEGTVDGEGSPEGLVEGEGGEEGQIEGHAEGQFEGEGMDEGVAEGAEEGQPEGVVEGEGLAEGLTEGEGMTEGEGTSEGQPEGTLDGEGVEAGSHTADQNADGTINLTELLRVIQFFNIRGFHCVTPPETSEDGFLPGAGGDQSCAPHASDYAPQNWQISLTELLRLIQFFNMRGYHACPELLTEDGYCPGP
jgi:hypothetical protein